MSTTVNREPEAETPPSKRFAARWKGFKATAADGHGHGHDAHLGQETGSEPPDVSAFLEECPEATAAERLAVLLIDQRERWRTGRERLVEGYLAIAAVADVAADPDLVRELVLGEFDARRRRGERVEFAAFLRRFPAHGLDLASQFGAADLARLAATGDLALQPTVHATEPSPPDAPAPRGTEFLPQDDLVRTTKPTHGRTTDAGLRHETFPAQHFPLDGVLPELGENVRFAIQRKIGDGGMGVVYQAYDRHRGEIVALKTMRRVDPVALYRFKNEFRALSDLSHPNLVSLYELVAVGDLWFYTMEVVPGLDFVSYVRGGPAAGEPADSSRAGLLPTHLTRLRPAVRQLVEGVIALHDAGKLHRDIKPPNVLVTPSGRLVLLDFGLTAELGRSGLHQADDDDQVVGTVGYMAPEQAAGRPLSKASDWYSVGVVLFEALTGRLPFEGPPVEVLRHKQQVDPLPPAAFTPGVPDDLNELCRALLSRAPGDRPAGREVLEWLDGRAPGSPGQTLSQAIDPPSTSTRGAGPSSVVGAASSGGHAGVPLIGRERHLAALWQAFDTVRAGRSVFLLVSGRSGSGKSTLLETFINELDTGDEAIVLAGRCYERESVPFKVLDSVIDSLSRRLATMPDAEARRILPADTPLLARMFPVLRRVGAVARLSREHGETPDEQESRRRAVAALRELLARIGRDRTLLMVIDDLQWGDVENATLIDDLLRPPDAPVMLLLGSYRTEDAEESPLICRLRQDAGPGDAPGPVRRELAVDPLTFTESRELTLALLGRSDAAALAEAYLVARESRGNPFFIAELVKHVQAGAGLTKLEGGAAEASRLELQDVIWSRVGCLSEGARRLLEVVAVSGRPLGLLEACQAANLASTGRSAASALRGARLIRGTGRPNRDEVETYHDWVRETVMARLPAATVCEHHLRLARVLETSGRADPETLAQHYEGADRPDRAADYYATAADHAVSALAFAHAARLYDRAIELREVAAGPDRDPSRQAVMIGLRTRLGDALAAAGRGRQAALAYREAAASPAATAAETIELKRREAIQLLISGHINDGLDVLRTLPSTLATTPPAGLVRAIVSLAFRRTCLWLRPRGLQFTARDESQVSAETLARIDLYWTAGAALSIIDPLRGAGFQTRGLQQALHAGEPYRVGRALTLEACHAALPGRRGADHAGAILSRAEALARQVGHPQLDGLINLARALILLTAGRWREACRVLNANEQIFRDRCRGVTWELDTLHNFLLMALSYLGELEALRRLWSVLMQEAGGRGDLYAATTLGTIYMALVRLADDEPDDAQTQLDEVMARWPRDGFHIQHAGALRAQVAIDLYRGHGLTAWQRVEDAWPIYRRSLLNRVHLIRVQLNDLRARAALAAVDMVPDPRPLFRAAEQSARSLEREQVPWAEAHAVMIRAGIAARRGQLAAAARLFRDATARFERAEMALLAAVARRRAGRFLTGAEGDAWRAAASTDLDALGVRRIDPFVAVFAPDALAEPENDTTISDDRSHPPKLG